MKFYDMDILRDFIKYASDSSLRERERTMFPAESFVSGRKTGVVVWNISEDTPLEFKVSVPARKLVLAQSTEDTALSSTSDGYVLAPQSIALLVFE